MRLPSGRTDSQTFPSKTCPVSTMAAAPPSISTSPPSAWVLMASPRPTHSHLPVTASRCSSLRMCWARWAWGPGLAQRGAAPSVLLRWGTCTRRTANRDHLSAVRYRRAPRVHAVPTHGARPRGTRAVYSTESTPRVHGSRPGVRFCLRSTVRPDLAVVGGAERQTRCSFPDLIVGADGVKSKL